MTRCQIEKKKTCKDQISTANYILHNINIISEDSPRKMTDIYCIVNRIKLSKSSSEGKKRVKTKYTTHYWPHCCFTVQNTSQKSVWPRTVSPRLDV